MKERKTETRTREAIPQQTASTPEPAPSTRTSVDSVLDLQQTIGNQGVQRLIQSVTEKREADTSEDDSIAQRIDAAAGSGQRLDPNIERQLEHGLSADLSRVQVHTDSNADQLARAVDAVAFTSGQDIFFREGTYDPGSQEGKRLLAHEVTHTVQQTAGPVPGTTSPGGVLVNEPSDSLEQEAEQVADNMVAGMPNTAQRTLSSKPPACIQRQAALKDEEQPVKQKGTLFRVVQRQGDKSGVAKKKERGTTNFKPIINKTYVVDAKTLEEAAQQFEQREEGGLTEWNPTSKFTLDENGNVASVTVDVPITVTLPRWPGATKLNKAAKAEWERAFKAIQAHEQHHANLVREKLEGLAEKMAGKSSADADAIFQEALKELQESSDAYDEKTDHGRKEGTIINTSAGTKP